MPDNSADFTRKELKTGKDTIVFHESFLGDTSCSADGRIVGYSYSSAGETYFRVRNLDTDSVTDVPLPQLPINAATLSRDGKLVAFIGAVSGALSVRAIDGGPARELVRANPPEQFLSGTVLAWSPDSQYVYYVKHRDRTSYSEVFRVRASGGPEERLGINGADVRNLSISPDGTRVAFAMGPRNRPEIWAIENTSTAVK